jgi:NADH-quinone oxidoreductase subunit N
VSIAVPSIHYLAIAPVVILFVAALGLLLASALTKNKISTSIVSVVSIGAALLGVVATVFQWRYVDAHGATTTIAHSIVMDGFSSVITAVILLSLAGVLVVAHDWAKREEIYGGEFQMLAMLAVSGAIIMGLANDLIVVFVGLEILSIALYVMIAFNRRRYKSAESSLKYFLLGGFASSMFVYGAALVYGATGTTNISSISYFLANNTLLHPGLLYAGGGLMLVGLAFKCQAVPFHAWAPDVYEGAPTPVTGFHASIVWGGSFAALTRVMISGLGTQIDIWRPIIWVLAALSVVVGAGMSMRQRSIKRFLAYSSISHAGFLLLGVWSGDLRGTAAIVLYLMTYAPIVVGSFAIVALVGGKGDADHDIAKYRGLGRRQPLVGGALAVLLLSQLGAPLTLGFYAKLAALESAVDAGGASLALIAILGACIGAFVYLRWILAIFGPNDESITPAHVVITAKARVVIILGVSVAVLFGLWPGPLETLANHATLLFQP